MTGDTAESSTVNKIKFFVRSGCTDHLVSDKKYLIVT